MTLFPYTPEVREDWPEVFKSPGFWEDWRSQFSATVPSDSVPKMEWTRARKIELAKSFLAGESYAEIADRMGISRSAVINATSSAGGRGVLIAEYLMTSNIC